MKYKRQEMIEKIIVLAQLPRGTNTRAFFSKAQITALYLFLQKSQEEFARLKERVMECRE
jgi:hypothetical protein